MPTQLTFPPGTIAEGAQRLPILHAEEGWLALNKPPGVRVSEMEPGSHRTLVAAIRESVARGEGQFIRHGLAHPDPVNLLDADASGVVVLSRDQEVAARLRHELGSGRFSFTYFLIAERRARNDPEAGAELVCQLPLAWDAERSKAFGSRRAGRKCCTRFSLLAVRERFAFWRAESDFPRFHQIRFHARALELRLVGERVYHRVSPASLVGMKGIRLPREATARTVNDGLCLHLATVKMRLGAGSGLDVTAPFTRSMRAAVKHFGSTGTPGGTVSVDGI